MAISQMMIEYRSVKWWYWLASACFLTAGVCGWPSGYIFAIGLTVFQFVQFAIIQRSGWSFPNQVRLGYLLLLLIAQADHLRWIYRIPTIGTWAMVLTGYCAMARMVSLMPWNRKQPLSMALLKQTFFSAPVRGSFMRSQLPAVAEGQPVLSK